MKNYWNIAIDGSKALLKYNINIQFPSPLNGTCKKTTSNRGVTPLFEGDFIMGKNGGYLNLLDILFLLRLDH